MCLLLKRILYCPNQDAIDNCLKATERIAEEDIIVYKVLLERDDGSYCSPFQAMKYEKGKTYCADVKGSYQRWFHEDYYVIISEGLHAYTKESYASNIFGPNNFCSCEHFEMTIPKGAKYWISLDGREIVSDTLIFK